MTNGHSRSKIKHPVITCGIGKADTCAQSGISLKQLESEKDAVEMLACETAVLFIFVSWSDEARRGRELVNEAEAQFAKGSLSRSVSWSIGDISYIESPIAPVLRQWLTEQEKRTEFNLFPKIACGYGSVVWMTRGAIVNFAHSAMRLELEGTLERTQNLVG